MCHSLLSDSNFFHHLHRLDEALAADVRAQGCPYCGGELHQAHYPRKPRGVSRHFLGCDYEYRLSFCCAREGCRRRTTPGSVRFLGRRMYLSVVVVLVTVLASGVSVQRARLLSEQLGVSERSLQRWRQWWRRDFVRSVFWQVHRSRFSPPPLVSALPSSLWACFSDQSMSAQWSQLLVFIAPVTTQSGQSILHTD